MSIVEEKPIVLNIRAKPNKSDITLDPSYTRLQIPYRVICRQRYAKSGRVQINQFLNEHSRIELLQPRALDGVRIHRLFCENVLTPVPRNQLIHLTDKEKRRVEFLLNNTIT